MPIKILMVCLGNICRSPLAEGILQAKLPRNEFVVDSAGTGGWHTGEQPDKRSVTIAKKKGLDITYQRARQFKVSDFETFDHIYVMDMSNYKNVLALSQNDNHKEKVKLILNELFPDENVEVPDPYYGGQDGFEQVYDMLDKACDVIVEKLKKRN